VPVRAITSSSPFAIVDLTDGLDVRLIGHRRLDQLPQHRRQPNEDDLHRAVAARGWSLRSPNAWRDKSSLCDAALRSPGEWRTFPPRLVAATERGLA
jgi:hypothetical protein